MGTNRNRVILCGVSECYIIKHIYIPIHFPCFFLFISLDARKSQKIDGSVIVCFTYLVIIYVMSIVNYQPMERKLQNIYDKKKKTIILMRFS